ncbi:hypothetical protein [Clostridium butyricum]
MTNCRLGFSFRKEQLINLKEVNHSKIKETNRKKIIKLLLEKDEITKLDS